jgi:hypothetical protein
MEVKMKKLVVAICVVLLLSVSIQGQVQTLKPQKLTTKALLLHRLWVKVLCMNKWNDNTVANSAMVVLKEKNQSGAVISDAKVVVNGRLLAFNAGIQTYMGNIGLLRKGQKVPIKIKTKDGRKVTGWVKATYFVKIVAPSPFTPFLHTAPIPVHWKFNDGATYLIVFKILRGETQLFSTDVNGSVYTINLGALGFKVNPPEVLRSRVISPWTEDYVLTGPVAVGSKAQFFTSATVSIKIQ